MNTLELIRQRHSVRSYLEKKIEPEKQALLREKIEELNQKSGLHIQFSENADGVYQGFVSKFIGWKNVPSCFALIGRKEDGLEEKCGYYGEQLVLFCQSIGLNTCWAGIAKFDRIQAQIGPDEKMVISIAVGYGADNGKPHRSKGIHEVTDVKEMPDWFKAGVESALLAPTAINQQKFLFSLCDGKPVAKISAKGPFVNVDLGIAKYHFEAASQRKLED